MRDLIVDHQSSIVNRAARSRRSSIALLVMLAVFVSAFSACDENQIRRAASASEDMARGIGVGFDLLPELYRQQFITAADGTQLNEALHRANNGVRLFRNKVAEIQARGGQLTEAGRFDLLGVLSQVTSAMRLIEGEVLPRIGNEQARARLAAAVLLVSTSTQIVSGLLVRRN